MYFILSEQDRPNKLEHDSSIFVMTNISLLLCTSGLDAKLKNIILTTIAFILQFPARTVTSTGNL